MRENRYHAHDNGRIKNTDCGDIMNRFIWMVLFFAGFCFNSPSLLHAEVPGEIEIIFDASGSMNDPMAGTTKLASAKQVLTQIAGQIPAASRVGLRMFGTTQIQGNVKESCTDSILAIPIGPFRKELMVDKVQAVSSHGMTALGYSLEQAGKDFSAGSDIKKTIILISDGEETCGKDPLAVLQSLKTQGIQLVIHSVGFGASDAAKAQLKELAEQSQGSYREAEDAPSLLKSLEEVVQKEMLLTAQKSSAENILAATSGTRIVSSSTEEFAKLIDGNDQQTTNAIYDGQEVVFSFRDHQPILLESFSVPVFKVYDYNPGQIKLMGSVSSSENDFFPILEVKVENKVFFNDVYQTFKIDPPAAIRYLKAVVGPGAGGGGFQTYHAEWRASGKYLSEEEFSKELEKTGARQINLLSDENGGHLIAAANMDFQYLIDGRGEKPGKAANIQPQAEGIFGFRDENTASIQKLALPVFETSRYNCKAVEFSVSVTTPTSGYVSLGTFETTDLVFAGNPYQEYVLKEPVKAKYLKVKVISTHGASSCNFYELRAFGTFENS